MRGPRSSRRRGRCARVRAGGRPGMAAVAKRGAANSARPAPAPPPAPATAPPPPALASARPPAPCGSRHSRVIRSRLLLRFGDVASTENPLGRSRSIAARPVGLPLPYGSRGRRHPSISLALTNWEYSIFTRSFTKWVLRKQGFPPTPCT